MDLLARIQGVRSPVASSGDDRLGSVALAVEAMRRGARDFIQKPWDNARLLAVVRTQVELVGALRREQRLEAENIVLRDSATEAGPGAPTIVAESQPMKAVMKLVARIGPADANILITGENGAGKGLIARAVHLNSTRSESPWCRSMPGRWRKVYLKASCLVMCAARLPTQRQIG